MHQLARPQAHIVWHQHQLSQRGHQTAEHALRPQKRRSVGALEQRAMHVHVDGQPARLVKPQGHEQRPADIHRVPEVGHGVGDPVHLDVVVGGKQVGRDAKGRGHGGKLALRKRGLELGGLGQSRLGG